MKILQGCPKNTLIMEILKMNKSDVLSLVGNSSLFYSWLVENGILKHFDKCSKCKRKLNLKLYTELDQSKWVCSNSKCTFNSFTIRRGSLLYGLKLNIAVIILVIYDISKKNKNKDIIAENRVSKEGLQAIRQVLWNKMDALPRRRIGGKNFTVEIDETYLTKRKYNRGRITKKLWCVGGVCRESKECFFEIASKRSLEKLNRIVFRNVKKKTRVITDSWRGYNGIASMNFSHNRINHSENFVDQNNKEIHTQNIENRWKHLKDYHKTRGTNRKRNLKNYLKEYFFLQREKWSFSALLSLIKVV